MRKIVAATVLVDEKGPRRLSPFFIPSSLINLASGHVSIRYGFRGPNHSVVTACSTGAHAIGDASHLILRGDADVMVAGGAEAGVCHIGVAGFAAARPAQDHRHANHVLVVKGALGDQSVLAEELPVVAGKNYQGVLRQAQFLQTIEDESDVLVHAADHAVEQAMSLASSSRSCRWQ